MDVVHSKMSDEAVMGHQEKLHRDFCSVKTKIFPQVMERANIHDVKGKVLVEFNENQGTFDFPRGRYSIEMYSHFMRMHGSRCVAASWTTESGEMTFVGTVTWYAV